MVKRTANLKRKIAVARNPKVQAAERAAMEKGARETVAMMRSLRPFAEIEIGWTWGRPPKGATTVGAVGSPGTRISIWARGDTFDAKWFEFGTAPRFHKSGQPTGQIAAQPFFFASWRAMRQRVRSRITREMRKAIKEAGK